MPENKIPYGDYCYTPVGWQGRKYKVNPCFYWGRDLCPGAEIQIDQRQIDGWDMPLGLLWDRIKECGINEEP